MITLNQIQIKPTIFPDKTSQIWQIDATILNSIVNCIKWDFESEAELMHVAQLVHLLREISDARITLQMDYFPYARQDKPVSNSSTFAVRTFVSILDNLGIDDIITFDVHSDIPSKLFIRTRFTNQFPLDRIDDVIMEVKPDLVIYPDAGAEKRYAGKIGHPYAVMDKKRNQLTGALEMNGLKAPEDDLIINGDVCLVVDDLCDGGGTFIQAAKALYSSGAKQVHLYTSHGIYSKGLTPLREAGIIRIFNRKGEV